MKTLVWVSCSCSYNLSKLILDLGSGFNSAVCLNNFDVIEIAFTSVMLVGVKVVKLDFSAK